MSEISPAPAVNGSNTNATIKEANLVSQRHIELEESDNGVDIISDSFREEVSKALSKSIEKGFEFIDIKDEYKSELIKTKTPKDRVKLLKDCDVYVKLTSEEDRSKSLKYKKPIIKRRIIEIELLDELEKCKQAAVDPKWILSKKETESWHSYVKGELFEYKRGSVKGSTYHFIEPTNEFTKIRKKNCWSEKKISREKQKHKK